MDSIDIENFENDIEEIQASVVRASKHEASEDIVEDLKRDLGERLGNMVYDCEGFNDYKLNRSTLKELQNIGTVTGDKHNPILLIENPLDENDPIEVPIINPTEQFPS